jgi:hypothetical protein
MSVRYAAGCKDSKGMRYCRVALKGVFLNLWAGQWLGRNKAFYGPLF